MKEFLDARTLNIFDLKVLSVLHGQFLEYHFIYFNLLLAVLGLCCCVDFSLVVVSGGYSLVVVWELLIAVAFVVEYRL